MTRSVTREQFVAARALAAALGHLWSTTDLIEQWRDGDPVPSLDEIAAAAAAIQTPPGGICAPYLDENGNVVHGTTTGRMRYTIAPSGRTIIEIMRPTTPWTREGTVVLRAVGAHGAGATVERRGAFGERHVTCLLGALATIGAPPDPATVEALDRCAAAFDEATT